MKTVLITILVLVGLSAGSQNTPLNISAKGYDSHVELNWSAPPNTVLYKIFDATTENPIFKGETKDTFFIDFVDRRGTHTYIVEAFDKKGKTLGKSQKAPCIVREFSDDELLEMVQRYTFRYFWDYAQPDSGLTYERTNDSRPECVTIGGSGMGLMAVIVGAERGWITREQAYGRLTKAVDFLTKVPRFKGMWAHWYNGRTGQVYSFSEKDNGGDIVESSFMAQGLLAAFEYFDQASEKPLRDKIDVLWRGMDWNFYTQGKNVLYWHWSPQFGFEMNHPVHGYNEALITYILAAASPTHPIKKDVYMQGWASWDQEEYSNYSTYYGIMLPLGNKRYLGGPLFFAHYSYLGLCPKGLRDRHAEYWQQNVRQTLINRAYCIDNPHNWVGYGENFWGITASDRVPEGYSAHMPGYWFDEGTIAPTAALSSMPYTPRESMAVLKNLYRNLGKECFGYFGFYDAVNLSVEGGPVRKNYIAIDQGPIIVMIENHRSELLWKYFMKNKDLLSGLDRLGFMINNKPIISPKTKN